MTHSCSESLQGERGVGDKKGNTSIIALFMGPSSSAASQTKENKIIKRAAHQSFIVPHVALARALPPPGRPCQLGGTTGSAKRRSDVTPGWTSQRRPVSLNPDPLRAAALSPYDTRSAAASEWS